MKLLTSAVSWALVLYFGYCAFLFLLQRQMLFPRDLIEVPASSDNISGLEKIWLNIENQRPRSKGIESWYFSPDPSVKKTWPVVIFAHGNAELIDFWVDELKNFLSMGIGLLLVEYPGYGRSSGSPSQESITQTFVAAYDMLAARPDIDSENIIFMGRSLGGGAVCQLAAKRPSKALILMSTFISAKSFCKNYFVPEFLMRDPFDNLSVIKNYKNPVLIIHGKTDEVIPYKHGKILAKEAENSTLITYSCGHNDCPPNWNVFWNNIQVFLSDKEIIKTGQANKI